MVDESMSRTRKRHTPQQVIDKLRDGDMLLGQGLGAGEVARRLGVSEVTLQRWRRQYGGMKGEDMKRLKELEGENTRLKRVVANQALEIAMLKEIAKGEF